MVVYYSNTDNLEHRDQSEQRAMGMTKSRQVDFVDMIVRGTVEEKIINSLRSKIDMASIINGDNYKEWLV
jgi:SNF2 family DNA or RNA helicase